MTFGDFSVGDVGGDVTVLVGSFWGAVAVLGITGDLGRPALVVGLSSIPSGGLERVGIGFFSGIFGAFVGIAVDL